MSKVMPCLWFDGNAEEAARFYAGIIPNSRVDRVNAAPADYPAGRAGDTLTVEFTIDGRPYLGLNGGPEFRFTQAISLLITCEDQAEVDRLWAALCDGGTPGPCGWLKDRYGLSWQVAPRALLDLMTSPDRERAARAMKAMMSMGKIDIAALQQAAEAAP